MMHVGLWGSIHFHPVDERTRFILRRGVFPWGVVVGVLTTAVLFGTSLRRAPHGVGQGPATLGVLAFVCLLEWSFVAGWVIGAVLWTLRPGPNESKPNATDTRTSRQDRAP